jgi:hypothetical protein
VDHQVRAQVLVLFPRARANHQLDDWPTQDSTIEKRYQNSGNGARELPREGHTAETFGGLQAEDSGGNASLDTTMDSPQRGLCLGYQ